MERLLILACSERKVRTPGRLRAIDRYDGPAFRVLRKHLRTQADGGLTILVLSAKYGLIEADREIPWYNLRLTKTSADRLRRQALKTAKSVLQSRPWKAIGLCAGKEYRSVLDGVAEFVPLGARLDVLAGGLGKRLAVLRDWLRQDERLAKF